MGWYSVSYGFSLLLAGRDGGFGSTSIKDTANWQPPSGSPLYLFRAAPRAKKDAAPIPHANLDSF